MIQNKETDVVSVSNNTYIHIKFDLFLAIKSMDSIFAANSKRGSGWLHHYWGHLDSKASCHYYASIFLGR